MLLPYGFITLDLELLSLSFSWQFWIITITMGYAYFTYDDPNRMGNVVGRRFLGISSPMCNPPNLDIYWRPEQDGQWHELGFEKSNMISKLLESLHARMNSLLVCNLYNALYEVSDVY